MLPSAIMGATSPAVRQRGKVAKPPRGGARPAPSRRVRTQAGPGPAAAVRQAQVAQGQATHLALMVSPTERGTFRSQARAVWSALRAALEQPPGTKTITALTVFLKDPRQQRECERVCADGLGPERPFINYVWQPPCDGAALALEAWAIGGPAVRCERRGPHALVVDCDGVRWVYCAGIQAAARGVYRQTLAALAQSRAALARAGSRFERVVRTWFYLGGITEPEAETWRYQELNRARTDFYRAVRFHGAAPDPGAAAGIYPASTGIGMRGRKLALSCLALETRRSDVHLRALENPRQIPAYAYDARYSPQSPKFSRAVALRVGDHVTTWISGTASIVNSETRHPDGVEHQTEQTIDNIERLIAADNFARHGLAGAGARLRDLAGIRVYLKRPADWKRCRAICERRFGPVPALYVVADICRPELRVEIEGVAFSRLGAPPAPREVA